MDTHTASLGTDGHTVVHNGVHIVEWYRVGVETAMKVGSGWLRSKPKAMAPIRKETPLFPQQRACTPGGRAGPLLREQGRAGVSRAAVLEITMSKPPGRESKHKGLGLSPHWVRAMCHRSRRA